MVEAVVGGEGVDADHRAVAGVDLLLGAIGGFLNGALDDALLDGGKRTSRRLDSVEERAGAVFDAVRERFDRIRAGQRIDRVGDTGFGGDDLLRSERNARGLFRRQRQRLVASVAVQRLRSAEHRRQRLNGDAHDVVVGLLSGERAAGRLRVEAQLLRAAFVAPKRSRMMRAHSRRAARNLAISSRKSLWALKKNDSRWPKRLTSRPASIAAWT